MRKVHVYINIFSLWVCEKYTYILHMLFSFSFINHLLNSSDQTESLLEQLDDPQTKP